MNDLNGDRRRAAEKAFAEYDFEPAEVEDTQGWQFEDPHDLTRVVFLRYNVDEDTTAATFCVRFVTGTAVMVDAWIEGE